MARLATISGLTCLLVVSLTTVSHGDGLGLLLTTPEERDSIREWRAGNEPAITTIDQQQPSISEPAIHYNGMVINSRGQTSHWVNGRWVRTPAQAEKLGVSFTPNLQQGLEVKTHRSIRSTELIYIQPGETYQRQDPQSPLQQNQPPIVIPSPQAAGGKANNLN